MNIRGETRLDARVDPGNIGPVFYKSGSRTFGQENQSNSGVSVCEFTLEMNVHFHLIEGNGTFLLIT